MLDLLLRWACVEDWQMRLLADKVADPKPAR